MVRTVRTSWHFWKVHCSQSPTSEHRKRIQNVRSVVKNMWLRTRNHVNLWSVSKKLLMWFMITRNLDWESYLKWDLSQNLYRTYFEQHVPNDFCFTFGHLESPCHGSQKKIKYGTFRKRTWLKSPWFKFKNESCEEYRDRSHRTGGPSIHQQLVDITDGLINSWLISKIPYQQSIQ